MIQRLQNFLLHLAMLPAAVIIVSLYAFIAVLGLTAIAGVVIGFAEWISS